MAQQQQFILQSALPSEPAVAPQPIAPKEDSSSSSPPKRRAFAVKSTMSAAETYDDMNDRPRRKVFATKSTVSPIGEI